MGQFYSPTTAHSFATESTLSFHKLFARYGESTCHVLCLPAEALIGVAVRAVRKACVQYALNTMNSTTIIIVIILLLVDI